MNLPLNQAIRQLVGCVIDIYYLSRSYPRLFSAFNSARVSRLGASRTDIMNFERRFFLGAGICHDGGDWVGRWQALGSSDAVGVSEIQQVRV
jgi:hypothetical protein